MRSHANHFARAQRFYPKTRTTITFIIRLVRLFDFSLFEPPLRLYCPPLLPSSSIFASLSISVSATPPAHLLPPVQARFERTEVPDMVWTIPAAVNRVHLCPLPLHLLPALVILMISWRPPDGEAQ
eukprot:9485597-Pyramimonas_sp.AAC.2